MMWFSLLTLADPMGLHLVLFAVVQLAELLGDLVALAPDMAWVVAHGARAWSGAVTWLTMPHTVNVLFVGLNVAGALGADGRAVLWLSALLYLLLVLG